MMETDNMDQPVPFAQEFLEPAVSISKPEAPTTLTTPEFTGQLPDSENTGKVEMEEKTEIEETKASPEPEPAEDTGISGEAPISSIEEPAATEIDAEYSVTIDRTGGTSLGIDLSKKDDKALIIVSIKSGLVSKWNDENPSNKIEVNDRIVQVNGSRGDRQALLDECKTMQILEMKVLRGKYSVTLDRTDGARVGLNLDKTDDKALVIAAVNGGLIGKWNDDNPRNKVAVNDRIIEVNGIQGDRRMLLDECKMDKVLKLTLIRG